MARNIGSGGKMTTSVKEASGKKRGFVWCTYFKLSLAERKSQAGIDTCLKCWRPDCYSSREK